jgi:hypothetical protein
MVGHLDDWIAETSDSISARLEGAREAQKQTRFTLGLMAVVSMMMLILSYNAYLSFDSKWILARALQKDSSIVSADKADTVADLLTNQALQDWASSRNAIIELLGIRVSVDDAPVLGTISLFVFSLWLLLVTRRENHTVGSLLRDTDTARDNDESHRDPGVSERQNKYSNSQRWLIFHTIAANNLFVTFDRSMSRIESLRGANRLMSTSTKGMKGISSRVALRFARGFFFWFPVGVSAFVFYLDRRSYFQPDPFAPRSAVPGTSAPFFFESMVVFFACWIPLLMCCHGAARNSKATDNVLRDYGLKLQSDLLRQESHGVLPDTGDSASREAQQPPPGKGRKGSDGITEEPVSEEIQGRHSARGTSAH